MKNTDIEFILNHCLNNAMCGSERIKGIVTSNKIAEFVTDWMKANKLNIGVVNNLLFCGNCNNETHHLEFENGDLKCTACNHIAKL